MQIVGGCAPWVVLLRKTPCRACLHARHTVPCSSDPFHGPWGASRSLRPPRAGDRFAGGHPPSGTRANALTSSLCSALSWVETERGCPPPIRDGKRGFAPICTASASRLWLQLATAIQTAPPPGCILDLGALPPHKNESRPPVAFGSNLRPPLIFAAPPFRQHLLRKCCRQIP